MFSAALLSLSGIHAADFKLAATPETVCWGYYWAKAKPALRVPATATITTLLTTSPEALSVHGLPIYRHPAIVKAIYGADKGPGGYILTGPVSSKRGGARRHAQNPHQKIALDVPYAYNAFTRPATASCPVPYARYKIIPLDRAAMTANFTAGDLSSHCARSLGAWVLHRHPAALTALLLTYTQKYGQQRAGGRNHAFSSVRVKGALFP